MGRDEVREKVGVARQAAHISGREWPGMTAVCTLASRPPSLNWSKPHDAPLCMCSALGEP